MNPTDGDPQADDRTTLDLIGGLIGDARDLAVAHLDGIRLEVKQELAEIKTSTKYMSAAIAVFAVAGILLAVGMAQALWLYTSLPSWAAHLILAVVFAAGGGIILALRARRVKDADLLPEAQLRKIKQDAQWVASRVRDAVQ